MRDGLAGSRSSSKSNSDERLQLGIEINTLIEYVKSGNKVTKIGNSGLVLPRTRYSNENSVVDNQPFNLILCRKKESSEFYYGIHTVQDPESGVYTKVCTVSARKDDMLVESMVTEKKLRIKISD